MKPFLDRVLVIPKEVETEKNGIIIPNSVKEKPQEGTIHAIGKGYMNYETTLKPGDTVWYAKGSGNEIEVDGVEYLIMREANILLYENGEE